MTKKNRINTAVRLDRDLWERLKEEAEAREVSVNYLVNAAIKDFIPRLIPHEEFTLVRKDIS